MSNRDIRLGSLLAWAEMPLTTCEVCVLGWSGRDLLRLSSSFHDPKATSMGVFGPLPERDLRDTA